MRRQHVLVVSRGASREREQHAPAESAGAWVMRLQRAAGNRAVARLLGAPRASVARAIKIDDETFTHGSRKVVTLFNDVVRPELESKGYKARGVKARLVEFVKTSNATYRDRAEFLGAFMPWLQTQTRRVRGDKTTPVLKQFSVMGMSRPAWPEALKTLKGVEAGDNVRHVVRNATLKRALDVEFDRVPEQHRKAHFAAIAGGLGVQLAPTAATNEILEGIYKMLYLNPENLFAGEGPMNQVIGFSADPVRAIGEELIGLGEDATVNITDVYVHVMKAIYAAADKVRADPNYMEYLLTQINGTVQEAIGSLRVDESLIVPAEDAGELVADIGLGFGFDLIEGRVSEDIDDIAKRQGRLLWSERELGRFIDSKGTSGNLLDILKVFMGLAEAPAS